jgi:hypothetical protein
MSYSIVILWAVVSQVEQLAPKYHLQNELATKVSEQE